jgi:hypothetical protein
LWVVLPELESGVGGCATLVELSGTGASEKLGGFCGFKPSEVQAKILCQSGVAGKH